MMQAGARLYSPLAGLPLVDAWAGLRPALPDRLPAIGPVPGIERLFVATGHFRNGILLGPLTGKIVARLIAGEPPGVDLGPYSPGRFLPANG